MWYPSDENICSSAEISVVCGCCAPLCPSRWTWGSSPSYCLYKVCFWYADANKAQAIWACSYGNTSCNTHSPGCFTPNLCQYGSLRCSPPLCSLYKPQGPWCIFHTGFPRCDILKQPVLLGMTSSNPQYFVRGIFFISVYIAWNKDTDQIHMVPGMFSQVLARNLDLVTVWHNTSLSSLAVGTHGETILWLKCFNLHIRAMGWTY